jgi:hypothetical protein
LVALIAATLVGLLGIGVILWYGNRRPVDAEVTWGEAMGASTYVFFLMFWWYGVIPHQWLTWSGNELNWRPDAILFGPGEWDTIFGIDLPGTFPPFTMSQETAAHIIVVGIYGVALVLHVYLFMWWQNRGQRRERVLAAIPTSRYGRPLVRVK